MSLQDSLGHNISGANHEGVAAYERALRELQCFVGDPVASVAEAVATNPDFVMAHVLKGYLYGLSTDREAMAVARDSLSAAVALPASRRERAHVEALGHLVRGHWHDAGRVLAELTADEPCDALALQVGHQIDFFTGNAPMLRDRIASALTSWSPGMPGYHAVLGMQAFGLEETGDYRGAEVLGRQAVELEPRDGWARHAVAHVMEMQSRQHDGVVWMRESVEHWAKDSFLQVHNWWHLALFHYELGEIDAVLELYDGPIFGNRSSIALNMVDASAILWRLHLGGHDVGNRWSALAANWLPKAKDGYYAFNDIHAMMAFIGAGLEQPARDLLQAQREAIQRSDDNAAFTREVGHPLALALQAFGDGRYSEAVELIKPVRAKTFRFGGSHAQRDVIELTLIEAALRGGKRALAAQLCASRAVQRPDSPLSALFERRAAMLA